DIGIRFYVSEVYGMDFPFALSRLPVEVITTVRIEATIHRNITMRAIHLEMKVAGELSPRACNGSHFPPLCDKHTGRRVLHATLLPISVRGQAGALDKISQHPTRYIQQVATVVE